MKFSYALRKVALAAIFVVPAGRADADVNAEAQALLQKVENAYKTAATFSVNGQYEDVMQTAMPVKLTGTFKILFSRPSLVRVDWTDTQFGGEVVTSSIFTQDNTIYLLMGQLQKWSAQKDMEMGLSTAAGISHGITYAIPSLLRGQAGYYAFTSLQPPMRGTLNGRDCVFLTGTRPTQGKVELAIDPDSDAILQEKTTQVIRTSDIAADIAKARADVAKTDPAQAAKLVAPPAMPDFTSVQTTTYTDPAFGVTLKPADFVYPVPDDAKKVDNILQ
jgi:hypothetical protein